MKAAEQFVKEKNYSNKTQVDTKKQIFSRHTAHNAFAI